MAGVTETQTARDYRKERYEEMKFTSREAELLADAKGGDGFPLYWGIVKTAVENGCGHKMAIKIFT